MKIQRWPFFPEGRASYIEGGAVEFTDLKIILSSFGLWLKVSPVYNTDGSIKSFEMLDKLIEKYSDSEKAIIKAFVGIYHAKELVSFTKLYRCLDAVNTEKFICWWSRNFEA
jgi:hypothetical protein